MSEEFLCANCGCPKYEIIDFICDDLINADIKYKLVRCVNCNVVSAIKHE